MLTLGEFDADLAHSGNVGQLDQIAALQWVRDNIEHFRDSNAAGLPFWPEYTLADRHTMVLSADPQVVSDPMAEDRKLRQKLGV